MSAYDRLFRYCSSSELLFEHSYNIMHVFKIQLTRYLKNNKFLNLGNNISILDCLVKLISNIGPDNELTVR